MMGCLGCCNTPLACCPTSGHPSPQPRVHSGVRSTFLRHSYKQSFSSSRTFMVPCLPQNIILVQYPSAPSITTAHPNAGGSTQLNLSNCLMMKWLMNEEYGGERRFFSFPLWLLGRAAAVERTCGLIKPN